MIHYDITMDNVVPKDVHGDIKMSYDISMYTYHYIAMQNGVAMSFVYYVLIWTNN